MQPEGFRLHKNSPARQPSSAKLYSTGQLVNSIIPRCTTRQHRFSTGSTGKLGFTCICTLHNEYWINKLHSGWQLIFVFNLQWQHCILHTLRSGTQDPWKHYTWDSDGIAVTSTPPVTVYLNQSFLNMTWAFPCTCLLVGFVLIFVLAL